MYYLRLSKAAVSDRVVDCKSISSRELRRLRLACYLDTALDCPKAHKQLNLELFQLNLFYFI